MRTKYIVNYHSKKRGLHKDVSKEERAKELNNVICPKCKYQNHKEYIIKYGKCHLCNNTLDANYFKRTLLKKLKEGDTSE